MTMPTRLLVLGSPGSGKSSLARELAADCPVDLVHLDDEYWGVDWARPTEDEWRRRLEVIVARDGWIIDGNYQPTLGIRAARAETAIVLDLLPQLCAIRIVRRAWAIRRGNRSALPYAVRDRVGGRATRDLRRLLLMVLAFRRTSFWPLLSQLADAQVKTVVSVAGPGARRRASIVRRQAAAAGLAITVAGPDEQIKWEDL